ncbi:hypothetical protein ACFLZV_06815 [Candidatus Margulisiibacteriota bacterium]
MKIETPSEKVSDAIIFELQQKTEDDLNRKAPAVTIEETGIKISFWGLNSFKQFQEIILPSWKNEWESFCEDFNIKYRLGIDIDNENCTVTFSDYNTTVQYQVFEKCRGLEYFTEEYALAPLEPVLKKVSSRELPTKPKVNSFKKGFNEKGANELKKRILKYTEEEGRPSLKSTTFSDNHEAMSYKKYPFKFTKVAIEEMSKTLSDVLYSIDLGQNVSGKEKEAEAIFPNTIVLAENGNPGIVDLDAGQDKENLEKKIEDALKAGAFVEGSIYVPNEEKVSEQGELDNIAYYLDLAKYLVSKGVHMICIKDSGFFSNPKNAKSLGYLVKRLKELFVEMGEEMPVHIHLHNPKGYAPEALLYAAQNGADVIDVACTGLSQKGRLYSAGQPDIGRTVKYFRKYGINLLGDVNLKELAPISDFMSQLNFLILKIKN